MHENKQKKVAHVCEKCGKAFSAPSLLAQHAITHIDRSQTEVQCDCGKWVKNQNILRTHKLTHLQIPLQCPHCDKVKFNERALRSHISQSHAPPKHQCTICKKLFARPLMLKVCLTRAMNYHQHHIWMAFRHHCKMKAYKNIWLNLFCSSIFNRNMLLRTQENHYTNARIVLKLLRATQTSTNTWNRDI